MSEDEIGLSREKLEKKMEEAIYKKHKYLESIQKYEEDIRYYSNQVYRCESKINHYNQKILEKLNEIKILQEELRLYDIQRQ